MLEKQGTTPRPSTVLFGLTISFLTITYYIVTNLIVLAIISIFIKLKTQLFSMIKT